VANQVPSLEQPIRVQETQMLEQAATSMGQLQEKTFRITEICISTIMVL
jgi:hypothetical protein